MELRDTTAILFHFVIRNWKELVIDWYGDGDGDVDVDLV